jgi:hypothetical protein
MSSTAVMCRNGIVTDRFESGSAMNTYRFIITITSGLLTL